MRKKHAQEIGYKYLSQEKIVEDIINTISKSKINERNDNSKSKTDRTNSGLMRYNKTKSTKSKSKKY